MPRHKRTDSKHAATSRKEKTSREIRGRRGEGEEKERRRRGEGEEKGRGITCLLISRVRCASSR